MTWILDLTIKSSVILTAAWLGALALRRRPAAERHLWWCGAMVAVAMLPVWTVALPSLRVKVPASIAGPVYRFTADVQAPAVATPAPVQHASPGGAAQPVQQRGWTWPALALWTWAAGCGICLLRLAVAHLTVARLRRRASLIEDAEWTGEVRAAAAQLGVDSPVRLLRGPGCVPMTSGWRNPAIHLPAESEEWTDDRRRVVLLHEMAHVARFDTLTGAAANLTVCAYWFHPLAGLAARELVKERERASDDLVLGAGAAPSAYASHLLEIAARFQTPVHAGAGVCMARPSQLEGRLAAILDATLARGAARPAWFALAVAAAILIAAPLGAMRPQAEVAVPSTEAEMNVLFRIAVAQRNATTLMTAAAELTARHKYEEAKKLNAAAVELTAQQYGPTSREYAQALVEQGRLLRAAGKSDEAEAVFEKALSLQDSTGTADPVTIGYLAQSAHRHKQYETAVTQYQRALALPMEPEQRGRLLTGLADVLADMGRDAEAESNYRAALQTFDSESGGAAYAMEMLSRWLDQHGRGDESRALTVKAANIRAAQVAQRNSAPPAAQPAQKVGGGVEPPKVIYKVEPQYSEEARSLKVQGTVVLGIEIGPDGRVYSTELKQGIGLGLDEEAANAVRLWQFSPGMKNGSPVPVKATIEVNFRLM
jgi:TonB family protein